MRVFIVTDNTAHPPENVDGGPPSAGEVTIMPPACQNMRAGDMDTYMDEIKRVLDQMNVKECNNTNEKYRRDPKRDSGSSSERFSMNSWDNPSSTTMQRGMSQDSDISSNSSHVSIMDLRDNLEVICSLGEGASGEVAKAYIKTTGHIVARKVCGLMLTVRQLLPLRIPRSIASCFAN